MSLYETLRAAKGGTTERELEDTPPLSFSANGEPLLDWSIDGASGGVGDRTSNLTFKTIKNANLALDGSIVSLSGFSLNVAQITQGTKYSGNGYIYAFFENEPEIGSSAYDEQRVVNSFVNVTAPIDGYVAVRVTDDSKQINTGSTILPAEPYGYKIPITCGSETNTIYLDEPLGASDSISMTDTGISIPTVSGSNTLSVGTTVQPSSVYIKYKRGGDEMVTLAKIGGRYNTPLLEIRGLSTDTKPTTEIEGMIVTNGSTYIEIDTGDTYMFDAENGVWHNTTG